MGFFSKLKKVWSAEDAVDKAVREYESKVEEPVAPEPTPEPTAAPEPTPAPAASEAKEAPPAPAPAEPVEPEEPVAPVEPVAPPAPEPPSVPQQVETKDEEPQPEALVRAQEQWQKDLVLALRQAEPRLSEWLGVILEGIEERGDELWTRLTFLFQCLEAPQEEAQDFVQRFDDWLEEMDYEYVDEFKSELQYRLALALDLEDEEDERSRLFLKLSEGLSKTKEQITKQIDNLLTSHGQMDDAFWDELEEILIMADIGFEASSKLMDNLKERVRKAGTSNPDDFKALLKEELETIFETPKRITAFNPPEVVMMVGVNGVGKTTTIAKLAHRAQMQGRKVLIAAGDTFRAAAIEQLEIWAKRTGSGFFAKEAGSDPAAVAFEAIDKAKAEGYDLVLLDTAGRLHTKVNLMEELKKIERVCAKKHEGAPHRTILTVDATTGQNALSQTKLFDKAVGVDEIILTKLDGTAKGGIVVAIATTFNLPITFVGLGEKMEDLRPFRGEDFAKALLE